VNVYIFALSDTEQDAERKLRWGDYWFKDSLSKAMTKLGHVVTDDIREADVFINLHGGRVQGMPEWTWNVLWIIGHPDAITVQECDEYDAVYSESEMFAEHLRGLGVDCRHLPGASDFEPMDSAMEACAIFVGNWRPGRELPKTENTLYVWGEGWEGHLPEGAELRGLGIPHEELNRWYAGSEELVNQTYPDMERWGFRNPRYYDIAAVRGQKVPTFDECAAKILAGVPGWLEMTDMGCGLTPRHHMWGLDIRGDARLAGEPTAAPPETVFKWDLERGLPHETHMDVIVADNLLEHIHNLIPLLNDCHDALAPAGRMHIVVPNAADPNDAWADPTHVRCFVPGTFDYFNAEHQRWEQYGKGYGIKPWRVVYCREDGRFIRVMMRPAVEA
jgi:SAM-dependent methyltransferase